MGFLNKLMEKDSEYAVSVDIGARDIKIAEGRYTKKGLVVTQVFKVDTPEGVYKDGEIANIEALSKELKKALAVNNVSTENVHLVVNSTKIITREIEIPKVSVSEIDSLVTFQLGNYIPVNSDDYTARTLFLEYTKKEEADFMKMLLIGVPTEIIKAHYNMVERAGLKPIYMDYQGNAVRKLICTHDEINGIHHKGKTIATVDIGSNTTNISIVKDEELKISRVVEIGYKTGVEKTNLTEICDRIGMVLRYYTSRGEENKIDYILLHGGIADLKGIKEGIASQLGLETILMESLDGKDFDGELHNYANSIGGLIRLEDN